MRVLMALLILSCVLCIVSAITGIQAFEADSRTGTVITYWHGYGRFYAIAGAFVSAVSFYGVYRRSPLAWKLGWLFLFAGAANFIAEAWLGLIHQSYGWIGAVAATLAAVGVTVYWGFWWRKQKPYFIGYGDQQT